MANYISIRDDAGLKSLSTNEVKFLTGCALAESSSRRVLRGDGRGPGELRNLRSTLHQWDNGAACTLQWGKTRVSSTVTAELVVPNPDRPTEGALSINVDLSPMAAPSFGVGQPISTAPSSADGSSIGNYNQDTSQRLLSNRILRCLERTILVGGALDSEALCVQASQWVWKITLSVKVLDNGGNLLDASVMAAMAALRHYRKPHVEHGNDNGGGAPTILSANVREPTPLPLHHTPLTMSFALIRAQDDDNTTTALLVDPTDREELVQTGSITMAMNVHGEVCLLDFCGGCELKPVQLKHCWELASKAIKKLCLLLGNLLEEANEEAMKERLARIQRQQGQAVSPSRAIDGDEPPPSVPFWQESSQDMEVPVETFTAVDSMVEDSIQKAAEEAYRLQALDFSQGHVAAKVKDDNEKHQKDGTSRSSKSSSLLAAMLQSVNKQDGDDAIMETDTAPAARQSNNEDIRSQQAKDEFAHFANDKKRAAASKKKTTASAAAAVAMDSDEEEATTMLQSEFQSGLGTKREVKATTKPAAKANNGGDNDMDVDDLAQAIKSKKKKKSKKK